MIMEAFSIIALFAHPVHEIQTKMPQQVIHLDEKILSESFKINLKKVWCEFQASEAIHSSA